jgi:hypothetical protein
LQSTQKCFTLPCGQQLHSAQLRFNLPWGQGVHVTQSCFPLPWGHRFLLIVRARPLPRAAMCGRAREERTSLQNMGKAVELPFLIKFQWGKNLALTVGTPKEFIPFRRLWPPHSHWHVSALGSSDAASQTRQGQAARDTRAQARDETRRAVGY